MRVITEEEGKNLAKELNMDYIETSAKTNNNIIKAFDTLFNKIVENNILDIDDIPDKDEYFESSDYEEKNLAKNTNFFDWKKTNLKKYGNDAILFKH